VLRVAGLGTGLLQRVLWLSYWPLLVLAPLFDHTLPSHLCVHLTPADDEEGGESGDEQRASGQAASPAPGASSRSQVRWRCLFAYVFLCRPCDYKTCLHEMQAANGHPTLLLF
jgi:hypothetical protein